MNAPIGRWLRSSAALLALHLSGPGQAAVFALDDSATVVHGGSVAMRWRADQPGRSSTSPASSALDGTAVVSLVLNTQPWAGRQGRVYMLLAPQPVRFVVHWTSRGIILPGRIEPGQRVLVYEGPIPGPSLRDSMEVALSADGREYGSPQRLNFSYEIEVQP